MNDLRLTPVILMHNILLPGLEEQIISVYKESSISAIDYSIKHSNSHIVLGLDHEKESSKLQVIDSKLDKNNEDLEKNNFHAGVLCKILNRFDEPRDGKNYVKILLSIKSRVILKKIEKTIFNDQEISYILFQENSYDDLDYIENNILKFNKFHFHQDQIELYKNENQYEIEKKTELLMQKFKNYSQVYGSIQSFNFINEIENYSQKIDRLAYEFQLTNQELFDMVTEFSVLERIKLASLLVDKAILKEQLNKTIDEQVRDHIEKTQKIYLLGEKAKIINKELETLSGESSDIDILENKLSGLQVNEEVRKKFNTEIRRLKLMNNNSSDAAVIRNYLDWCANMPWNSYSPIKTKFSEVFDELNKEHYGMQKIKERILEYLAVDFRGGNLPKSALLLVGPPGVGKTSLSRKIAFALGREFARISLGGIRDEADIRGHRRTYLGSMPGKIMQAIRDTGVMNPVILLDEIDKIGSDFRGDPAAALLEVLDKEQNKDFLDHYLDVPFDLSKILFICTANSLETISRPLMDRIEIIQLASYSDDEKFKIATDYMIPKQIKQHGLKEEEVIFENDVVKTIISRYTYEAGVRNLEEQISILLRKTLLKIINENADIPISISKDTLESFIGMPKYLREQIRTPKIGVIQGLAWNALGGDVLTIESVAIKNDTPNYVGSIKYTGKLGEVMQESIQTAFSYLKSCKEKIGVQESDYKNFDIHLHVPEGGTPKDGPSAGVTIFCVLVSLLTNQKIRSDVAMTGEITLRGRVTAIGGLKEKILAAKRNGIVRILIPKENDRELNEIPKEDVEGIEIFLIEQAEEALQYIMYQESGSIKKTRSKVARK